MLVVKRFLVFAGYNYYPDGGWDDFVEQYDSSEEAQESVTEHLNPPFNNPKYSPKHDWAHVVDTETGRKCAFWCQDDRKWFVQ